ncbi:MAG: tetratricopeptide repeat protein [candidate division WOR-3 bacterium]
MEFIPSKILKWYDKNNFEKNFEGSILFLDIKGFTSLTENLMKSGKSGAETLSKIINFFYNDIIDEIYKNDGFVTTFAGDAFTAVFDGKKNFCCAVSAYNIIKKIENKNFGLPNEEIKLSVKISIVSGRFKILFIGEKKKIFLLKGSPIKKIHKMQDICEENEILCDNKTYENLVEIAKFEKKEEFYKILHVSPKRCSVKEKTDDYQNDDTFFVDEVYRSDLKGEFRNVISIFINFKNSSNEKNVRFYVENLLKLKEKYDGFLSMVEYSDKGLLCYIIFGAPIAFENDISKSSDFVKELVFVLGKDVRIGITFGSVYFGKIGSEKKYAYTSISSVVNLAARIAMRALWGEIWCDSVYANKLQKNFDLQSKGFFKFKGIVGERQVFKLGEKIVFEKKYINRFIGREEELKRLTEIFKGKDKNMGILFVFGQAGIGKTRFVEESLKSLDNDVDIFWEQTDEIIKDFLEVFRKFLAKNFKIDFYKNNKQNEKNFETVFYELLNKVEIKKDVPVEELKRTKIFLKSFLGFDTDLDKNYDDKVILDNIKIAIKEFVKIKSSLKPLILIFDDSQWLDEVSLKFIPELMTNVSDYPFGLIILSRDDERIKNLYSNLKNAKSFQLQRFERENVKLMMETILKGPIKDKLLNFVETKSEGNPFFLEQILLFLNENGYIKYDNNGFDIEKIDIDIFSGINSIIIARLDRLSKKLKRLVQHASVLGKEFDIEILNKMAGMKDIEVELVEGTEQNIWYPSGEMKYIFSHSLIKDAAYEMQLEEDLIELHKLAALSIEEKYKNNPVYFADLAFHYEKSKNYEKYEEYLKKAAEFAKKEYREEDALRLNQKLFNIQKDNFEKLKTGILIAHSLFYLSQYKQEEDFLNEIFKIIKDKESEIYAEYLNVMIELQIRLSDYDNALENANRAYEIFKKNNNLKEEIRSIKNIGKIYYDMNQYEKSLAYFKESLKKAKEAKFDQLEHDILGSMALYYFETGEYDEGIKLLNKKIEYDRKNNKKREMCYAMGNLGLMLWRKGELDKALKIFQEILNVAKEQGDRYSMSASISNIGMIYYFQKKYDEALKFYQEAFTINEEIGNKYFMGINLGNIGNIYSALEEFDTAQEYYLIAASIFEEIKNYWALHLALYEMSKINFYKDDLDQMKNFAEKSYNMALKLNLDDEIAASVILLIQYFYEIGDMENLEIKLKELENFLEKQEDKEKKFVYDLYNNLFLLRKGEMDIEKRLIKMVDENENLENKARLFYFLFKETKNLEYKTLFLSFVDKVIESAESLEFKMMKRKIEYN